MKKDIKELLECIQNLMGFFDTPIARRKMQSKDCEEVRKIGREVLKKYNNNLNDTEIEICPECGCNKTVIVDDETWCLNKLCDAEWETKKITNK